MRQYLSFIFGGLALAVLSFAQDRVPEDLDLVRFSGPDVTPSPACLCVAPTGEVFVGVDMNGSLGKGPGKGMIIRLIDSDQDGVADSHTEFAKADSARGLISVGADLYVLHTTYDLATGEASGMDLTLFTDADWDGVADGPGKTLVKGICSPESIRSRGTDHSTNGIRMGIDGWIYAHLARGFCDRLDDRRWLRRREHTERPHGSGNSLDTADDRHGRRPVQLQGGRRGNDSDDLRRRGRPQ